MLASLVDRIRGKVAAGEIRPAIYQILPIREAEYAHSLLYEHISTAKDVSSVGMICPAPVDAPNRSAESHGAFTSFDSDSSKNDRTKQKTPDRVFFVSQSDTGKQRDSQFLFGREPRRPFCFVNFPPAEESSFFIRMGYHRGNRISLRFYGSFHRFDVDSVLRYHQSLIFSVRGCNLFDFDCDSHGVIDVRLAHSAAHSFHR